MEAQAAMTTATFADDAVSATKEKQRHNVVSAHRSISSWLESVGRALARYGLVVVVGWIGLMKFTAYEAEGIRPFVANSPLLSWVYVYLSVQGFSALLG